MRPKFFLVIALAGTSVVAAFATGKVLTCADQYKQCTDSSTNAFFQCKSTGRDPDKCDKEKANREVTCNAIKAQCEKRNPAEGTKPKPKK